MDDATKTTTITKRLSALPFFAPRLTIALPIATVLAVIIALHSGAVSLHWQDVVALLDWYPDTSSTTNRTDHAGNLYVLGQIRIPRIVFSLLIGACLGLSGALTQALFRNPLADPSLFGVSAGAACAVALSIVFLARIEFVLAPALRLWLLPIIAFGGALATCFLLDRIARWLTPGSVSGLLLTGIAINALATAVIGLCTYMANDEQLRNLSTWLLGSLSGASWLGIALLAMLLAFCWWRIAGLRAALNALALGEANAFHVGVEVQKIRRLVFISVALLTGFAVAWCGIIGFIGLIAPHLIRLGISADQRILIPQSMLMGALLLLIADTLARTIAIPAEVPVGIFTALIGAPFFLFLLRHARNKIS